MKIYTKRGDKGKTSLVSGVRVSKNHIRVESYGTVDELNSYLGLIRDQEIGENHKENIIKIQNELFVIGAMLASEEKLTIPEITSEEITFLEEEIDKMSVILPKQFNFVLPGGHQTVSLCHIARCICRRAERLTVELHQKEVINELVLQYLNRLSDYLFILARKLSSELEIEEVKWMPKKL